MAPDLTAPRSSGPAGPVRSPREGHRGELVGGYHAGDRLGRRRDLRTVGAALGSFWTGGTLGSGGPTVGAYSRAGDGKLFYMFYIRPEIQFYVDTHTEQHTILPQPTALPWPGTTHHRASIWGSTRS